MNLHFYWTEGRLVCSQTTDRKMDDEASPSITSTFNFDVLFPLAAAPEDAQISGNSMDEIKQMIQTTGDKATNLALDNIKQQKEGLLMSQWVN